MVGAILKNCTRTDEPIEITSDVEVPLIDASQVEGIVFITCTMPTKVEFETIGAETHLIGEFCIGTSTCTETDTECILSVASEAESNNCEQKYENFLHNVVIFKLLINMLVFYSKMQIYTFFFTHTKKVAHIRKNFHHFLLTFEKEAASPLLHRSFAVASL